MLRRREGPSFDGHTEATASARDVVNWVYGSGVATGAIVHTLPSKDSITLDQMARRSEMSLDSNARVGIEHARQQSHPRSHRGMAFHFERKKLN